MGLLLWCNSTPETAVPVWPYRDSWAPSYTLACGNWVSGHENHRPGFNSSTHSSTSAEAHACTLSNRKPAPLQRCSFWTVCDLHWQREGNERRAYFSSLLARPVRRDVWESKAGQFLLALSLLSMCFAYGHTPLAYGHSGCRKQQRTRLLSNPGLFKFKCSVIWKWHEEE